MSIRHLIITLPFLLLGSVGLATSNDAIKQGLVELKDLIIQATPRVPSKETLSAALTEVRRLVAKRREILSAAKTVQSHYLIYQTIDRELLRQAELMISQKKIRYLSDELVKAIQSTAKQCNESSVSSQSRAIVNVRGIYLYGIDIILIDERLSPKEFAKSLLHEVIHSFQSRYKNVIDLGVLTNLSKRGVLKADPYDYLFFLSEMQAHWYTSVAAQDEGWVFKARTGKELRPLGTRILQALSATATIPRDALRRLPKGPVPRSLMGENKLALKIPWFDQRLEHFQFIFPDHLQTAFLLSEPLVLADTDRSSIGNIDLSFHKMFTKSVEYTYYCKLPYTFSEDESDQEVFKELVNETNRLLFGSRLFKENSFGQQNEELKSYLISSTNLETEACDELRSEISTEISPLFFWFSTDGESAKKCPSYANLDIQIIQSKLAELFETSTGPALTGLDGKKGTEGGGGDLSLVPRPGFYPQYELQTLSQK